MQTIASHEFQSEVLESISPAFVMFSAPWCVPCKTSAPILERMEAKYPAVKFAKVNVEESPDLIETYGIRSLPTFLVFRDGQVTATRSGMAPEDVLTGLLRV